MSRIVTVARAFAAAPERVFDAWLQPAQAARFLFATPDGEIVRCDIDARVGGRFLVVDRRADGDAEHHGEFVTIDRPQRLAFRLRGPGTEEGEWTHVTIDITSTPGGCTLTLTHRLSPKWAAWADPVRNGWTMILDSQARAMENPDG